MGVSDIAGYTFQAENFMPEDLRKHLMGEGIIEGNNYDDMEDILDFMALVQGINRDDEYSFDSDNFPKVVYSDQLEPEYDSEWYDFAEGE